MLFDVTAFLATSTTTEMAVGAFDVARFAAGETSQIVTDARANLDILPADTSPDTTSLLGDTVSPVAIPDPVIGPRPASSAVEFDHIATLTGRPLLQQLGLLSKANLTTFVARNPSVIQGIIDSPPSTRSVAKWWSTLTPESRRTMAAGAPQLVGNLDGIPYELRNTANRDYLSQSIGELTEQITANPGRSAAADARKSLHMLTEVSEALGNPGSRPSRTLLALDIRGEGGASIVLGDLSTADYVSYMVPGMWFSVDGQIGDWTDTGARLYDDQVSWLQLFGTANPTVADKSVAVVAWMGTESPDLTNIGSLDLAYEGRDKITSSVEGLQTVRGDDQPYISLLAHSYGSTAVLMALTENDFEVDALALVGSPGSTAKSVDELHVRDGNVYAGEAILDYVSNSAFFGSDPGDPAYGAKPMSVSGGVDAITHETLAAALMHNEYFGAGSESMRNMALIGIGKGQYVTSPNVAAPTFAAGR